MPPSLLTLTLLQMARANPPSTANPQGAVTGFKDISNEAGLLDAVSDVGPISVATEADQSLIFRRHHDHW